MTQAELKKQIEKTAKEANCSPVKLITAMQAQCAAIKDEQTLSILCDIKYDYITT